MVFQSLHEYVRIALWNMPRPLVHQSIQVQWTQSFCHNCVPNNSRSLQAILEIRTCLYAPTSGVHAGARTHILRSAWSWSIFCHAVWCMFTSEDTSPFVLREPSSSQLGVSRQRGISLFAAQFWLKASFRRNKGKQLFLGPKATVTYRLTVGQSVSQSVSQSLFRVTYEAHDHI
jgi:hypothetical protein